MSGRWCPVASGRVRRSLVILMFWWAGTAAGGIRELPDGWLHTPAALARVINPDGGGKRSGAADGLWVAAGEGRLYGLLELPQQYLALGVGGLGTKRPGYLRVNIQSCGGELVEDSRWGGELGWGRSAGVGVGFARRSLLVAGLRQPTARVLTLHGFTSGGWGERKWYRLDAFLPVWSRRAAPLGTEDHERLCRLEIGEGGQSLSLVLSRDRQDVPHPDFELLLGDLSPLGLILRFEPRTGTVGPGICLGRPGLLIMTSHLVHPVLGTTHRLMVVLGRWEACRF